MAIDELSTTVRVSIKFEVFWLGFAVFAVVVCVTDKWHNLAAVKSASLNFIYLLLTRKIQAADIKMFLKDQIKIDIVILMQNLHLSMHSARWIEVNRILWFFIFFACIGMGPRAIGSSSANSGTSTVWCRSLVGVAARGSKSASEWSAIVVRIIGRGLSDHRAILEDFHWTRGKQLNATIYWDILIWI